MRLAISGTIRAAAADFGGPPAILLPVIGSCFGRGQDYVRRQRAFKGGETV
jgi:hypothetical protein